MQEKTLDEKIYVPVNGQNQYISIRSRDVKNPILLNLHGGPASPDAYLIYEFADEISKDFTFVCWDQRGCGRTYYENKKVDPHNKTADFEQAVQDVHALVKYLCKRFKKSKVILMGHSYGTLLGIRYVRKHPDKVEKYIGIGQHVSCMETQTWNYNEIMGQIEPGKEADKIAKAYKKYKETPTLDTLSSFQMLTLTYYQMQFVDIRKRNQLALLASSPDRSKTDLRWFVSMMHRKKHYRRNQQLLDYVVEANIYDAGTEFAVPMAFISGEYDRSCHVEVTKSYVEQITAPSKEIVILPKCGHSPQVDIPMELAGVVRGMIV